MNGPVPDSTLNAYHAIVESIGNRAEEGLTSFWEGELAKVAKAVETGADAHALLQEWPEKLVAPWTESKANVLMESTVEGYKYADIFIKARAGQLGKAQLELTIDPELWTSSDLLIAERVKAPVGQWAAETSKIETVTSAKLIEKILNRTLNQPGSTTTLSEKAKDLMDEGITNIRSRANMLARTYSNWGANEGALLRYQDAGVTQLEWLATLDDAVRPAHAALHGARIATGTTFHKAGDKILVDKAKGTTRVLPFDVKHPPLEPNCRCVLVPVIDESFDIAETPKTEELADPIPVKQAEPVVKKTHGFPLLQGMEGVVKNKDGSFTLVREDGLQVSVYWDSPIWRNVHNPTPLVYGSDSMGFNKEQVVQKVLKAPKPVTVVEPLSHKVDPLGFILEEDKRKAFEEELAEMRGVLVDDNYEDAYIDRLLGHYTGIKKAGILDRMEGIELTHTGSGVLVDQAGVDFGGLRGEGGVSDSFAEYLRGNIKGYGRNIYTKETEDVDRWATEPLQAFASGQASCSDSASSLWTSLHLHKRRKGSELKDYWWYDHTPEEIEEDADYVLFRGEDSIKESFEETVVAIHALNWGMLRRVKLGDSNPTDKTVRMFRTEEGKVLRKQGLKKDGPAKVMKSALHSSASLFEPVEAFNNNITVGEVPKHRVIASYVFDVEHSYGRDGFFLGMDDQQEFVTDFTGIKRQWISSVKPLPDRTQVEAKPPRVGPIVEAKPKPVKLPTLIKETLDKKKAVELPEELLDPDLKEIFRKTDYERAFFIRSSVESYFKSGGTEKGFYITAHMEKAGMGLHSTKINQVLEYLRRQGVYPPPEQIVLDPKPVSESTHPSFPKEFDLARARLGSDLAWSKSVPGSIHKLTREAWYKQLDMTEEELTVKIQESVNKAGVYMAVDGSTLRNKVLKDGYIKNSLETGKGTFKTNAEKRVPKERQVFGITAETTDYDSFPKYGFLSDDKEMGNEEIVGWGYGDTFVKFRKDRVETRTTYTLGDSYDGNENFGVAPPTKLTDPVDKATHLGLGKLNTWNAYFTEKLQKANDIDGISRATGNYVEAQIYGRLEAGDIQTIYTASKKEAEALQKTIKKSALDIEVLPLKYDQRLKKLIGFYDAESLRYRTSLGPEDVDRLGDYYISPIADSYLRSIPSHIEHGQWKNPPPEIVAYSDKAGTEEGLSPKEKREFLKLFAKQMEVEGEGALPSFIREDYRPKLRGWTSDVWNEELLKEYPES